ncbi:sulfite exporter TauE/SafE family protein [Pontivivens ytuae]|uniref:Probable membrane transporter protein n=1 Tax=Pontivivens ytuae TaxID=2789856 RepID=A0A7S9QCQ1_9RHOB|nr:sulfite exporter TauE/SafE family protein [Pontivivens ytuae]QPH53602.1 sulfite exporter TauE/SafE family protein [Pontivivens ytuae]
MPPIADLLPLVLLLLATGALAGVVAGLLGVGGGIVLVPVFFYVFSVAGYESAELMRVCLATSLATIIVTSARSVSSHAKKGAVDWVILRRWGPGIVIGALIGVFAVEGLESRTLQMIFGILGCVIAAYFAFGKSEWRLGDQMPGGLARAVVSPVIGLLSVLMGIGGGSFGVPLMTLYGTPIHRAVATAAGFGILIAVPSVAGFLLRPANEVPPFTLGLVNIPAFLIVIAMTLVTAPLGVRLAHALPVRPLRLIFAGFILVMALNMLREGLTG